MPIQLTREFATDKLLMYFGRGSAGDTLPTHTTNHPAALTVLRGRVRYEEIPGMGPVEMDELKVQLIPAYTPHSVTLLTDALFQLVLPAEAKLGKQ